MSETAQRANVDISWSDTTLFARYVLHHFAAKDSPVLFAQALAELLSRAEHDEVFYRRLELAGAKLAPMVAPDWELRAWHQLLSSFP